MRIGLLRHFPVSEDLPRGWLRSSELHDWRSRYDRADAVVGAFNLGSTDWQVCISSDLPRAITTAHAVFENHIERTPLLREPQFNQFATGELRLPFFAWKWLLRLSWITGHSSQRACRDEFNRRVVTVADNLTSMNKDVLVISHAGMMAYLSAELKRRGFAGPSFRIARHANVYTFSNS
ncbi:MAG: histidine phosphatase family protein [Burkholderiales bacterium]|jgi:broad specificity phosphatase PhoE|nr:phosphoglycerate mutase [Rhodocyclaceae bacterium]MCZ2114973.1 histidine phosphatase family protein [Anaerolineae bacterium]MCZ2418213.1 histidine phosphatase family protein [Burkholderiales bacterium]RIK55753.1 MAG: phosphoglycerate mutase [candidate division KSB1 bacterium]